MVALQVRLLTAVLIAICLVSAESGVMKIPPSNCCVISRLLQPYTSQAGNCSVYFKSNIHDLTFNGVTLPLGKMFIYQ